MKMKVSGNGYAVYDDNDNKLTGDGLTKIDALNFMQGIKVPEDSNIKDTNFDELNKKELLEIANSLGLEIAEKISKKDLVLAVSEALKNIPVMEGPIDENTSEVVEVESEDAVVDDNEEASEESPEIQ